MEYLIIKNKGKQKKKSVFKKETNHARLWIDIAKKKHEAVDNERITRLTKTKRYWHTLRTKTDNTDQNVWVTRNYISPPKSILTDQFHVTPVIITVHQLRCEIFDFQAQILTNLLMLFPFPWHLVQNKLQSKYLLIGLLCYVQSCLSKWKAKKLLIEFWRILPEDKANW